MLPPRDADPQLHPIPPLSPPSPAVSAHPPPPRCALSTGTLPTLTGTTRTREVQSPDLVSHTGRLGTPCPSISTVNEASSKVSLTTLPAPGFVPWGGLLHPPHPPWPLPLHRDPPSTPGHLEAATSLQNARMSKFVRRVGRALPACWLLALQFPKCGQSHEPGENSKAPPWNHAAGATAPTHQQAHPRRCGRQVCGAVWPG